jgi:hypothetical protein
MHRFAFTEFHFRSSHYLLLKASSFHILVAILAVLALSLAILLLSHSMSLHEKSDVPAPYRQTNLPTKVIKPEFSDIMASILLLAA